jgi:hypothetical protein
VRLFRRQKDLLTRQREELGLDATDCTSHRRALALPGSQPATVPKVWRMGHWEVVVAPERKRSFWERVTSVRGVFAITLSAVLLVAARPGVLPDLTAVYLPIAVALGDSALWVLIHVRVRTARADREAAAGSPAVEVPAEVTDQPLPGRGDLPAATSGRGVTRRPLIENPWFVIPVAAVILFAWNGNNHPLLGLALLCGAVGVVVDRLVRGRPGPGVSPARRH